MFQQHSRMLGITFLAIAICSSLAAGQASAQQAYTVDYQLPAWKTLHFDDPGKADLHYRTIRGLGCEATKRAHGDHTDVTYRCVQWRRIDLTSDASAHNWEHWLQASGFKTKHTH